MPYRAVTSSLSAKQASELIAPDTSWEAISQRAGGHELTTEEWDQFIRKSGPDMLPADPEG